MKCTCPNCGHAFEINPAAMMGSKKKTVSEASIIARRENGKKGGRPKKIKPAEK